MPAVKPYYAVKCNPEPGLLRLLIALGTGFDCASKGELAMMLRLGVHPSNIIFAHPCKRPADILYAKVGALALAPCFFQWLASTPLEGPRQLLGRTRWPLGACFRAWC